MSAPEHVYVHVPFCRRRCVYCDFSIAVRDPVPTARFAEVVLAELAMRAVQLDRPDRLQTVYLGGGTPSLLDPRAVGRIIEGVLAWSGGGSPQEVTLEANPEDVTAERARGWRSSGVTRISLGVQSFENPVLRWMRRPHDADAVPKAVDAIRSAGIESLSVDLIIGLPASVGHESTDDLRKAIALEPDHMSVYALTFEPNAPLGKWQSWGHVTPAPDERYAAQFLAGHEVLTAAGFEHYEVSNYARPGCRSRHNSAYWSGRDYLGVGPSAHSFLDGVRSWNIAPWAPYERAVSRGASGESDRERLTEAQRRLERAFLGLRTAEGLPSDDVAWQSKAGQTALRLSWAEIVADRFRLTPEGWLRLDSLVGALTTGPEGG